MRELNGEDFLNLLAILDEVKAKEEVEKLLANADNKDMEKVGFELLWNLVSRLARSAQREQIWEFLAGPAEMDAKAIAALPLSELKKIIVELVKENDFKSFFSLGA